jgi:hypothetical protein
MYKTSLGKERAIARAQAVQTPPQGISRRNLLIGRGIAHRK